MDEELEDWADRLEATAASTRFDPTRVRVFAACESTQEPARDLGIGSVVTTGRQTAGRGRLGRVWVEDRGTGIALSLGLPAMASDRACIAVAVASMEAVRGVLVDHGATREEAARVGLKFPNDLVDRRKGGKIGGILVEVSGELAVVGIGINVSTREWPAGIRGVSVDELAPPAAPSRIGLLERLLVEIDRAWSLPAEELDAVFAANHAPTGGRVDIGIGDEDEPSDTISGRLIELDPRRGLQVEADHGRVVVPVDRARILSWTPGDLRSSPT
ncbi:MAG: hypothetical protein CMJ34_08635 [Phycisphaerae bacterium]|nr:hypothetical protein [Phycisphaerae bacterium]